MGEKLGTICLIHDDPHLSHCLQKNDYDVPAFHDGEHALDALTNWLPNVIFLDLELPGLSGFEVLEKLQERLPQIPVVMTTGTDEVPTVVAAMKAGDFDYLVKPVHEARLVTVTRNAIERQRLAYEI